MQRVLAAIDEHLPDLVQATIDRILAGNLPFYRRAPVDMLRASFTQAFRALRKDLAEGTEVEFPGFLVTVGRQRAEQGVGIGEMLAVVQYGFAAVSAMLDRLYADDQEPRLWWEQRKFDIGHVGVGLLWDASLAGRDEIIRAQTAEIYRLGATIIPLHRGILLLPLVGTIDTKRAEQIMSALLDAIVARQSAVVILDVTGVPSVDTGVVGALVRAAQATRLLGAEPVLVGINARIAQSMVGLGVDMEGMTVRGTLEDGMGYALGRLGKKIIDIRPAG